MSLYNDHREDVAFHMPIDSEQQREAAIRYINYNIPYQDRLRLETVAYDTAPRDDDPDIRLFYIYSRFYASLFYYKIDRFLSEIFYLY